MKISTFIIILIIGICLSCQNRDLEYTYYPNGQVEFEIEFFSPTDYCVKNYYDTGIFREEKSFKDEIINGYHKQFHENGTLKEITLYEMGIAKGERIFYDKNGDMKQISYFDNGEIFYQKKINNDSLTLEVLSPYVKLHSFTVNGNSKSYVFDISFPFIDSLKLPYQNDDVISYYMVSNNQEYEKFSSTDKKIVLNKDEPIQTIEFQIDSIGKYYLKGLTHYSSKDSSLYFNVFPFEVEWPPLFKVYNFKRI